MKHIYILSLLLASGIAQAGQFTQLASLNTVVKTHPIMATITTLAALAGIAYVAKDSIYKYWYGFKTTIDTEDSIEIQFSNYTPNPICFSWTTHTANILNKRIQDKDNYKVKYTNKVQDKIFIATFETIRKPLLQSQDASQ